MIVSRYRDARSSDRTSLASAQAAARSRSAPGRASAQRAAAGSPADELPWNLMCYPDAVKSVRAHVRNGQIVLDEPVELVEGGDVEVLLPDHDELSVEDRTELEAAVEESSAEFERGEFEDARAFAARLLARP
jgi:hypothetical protein